MKSIVVILFLLSFNLFPQAVNELRAVWVTNVDSYALSTDKNISTAMDYLASIGVNLVFPVVWNGGYTLYPSPTMARLFNTSIHPTYSNRDPLEKVVIEGHRNGIEVIPWFEYGFSPYYANNVTDSGMIIKKYPSWASLNSSGKLATKNGEFPQFIWLSGINPEVQDFMINLVTEVCDKYDIDGIQGDDRLPAMVSEGGYDAVTVNIYKSENGGANPPTDISNYLWKKWRADKLTQFFKRLQDSVKLRSQNLIVSSAPSQYPWGYDNYLQDSKSWLEQNIIDNFIPQLYRKDLASYTNEVNNALSYVPAAKRNILFSGVIGKSGSYLITPDLLLKSIQLNRQKNIKGESIFFYEAYRLNSNQNGDTLKKTLYAQPANLPYRNGNIWRPKALVLNEDETDIDTSGKWQKLGLAGFKGSVLTSNDTNYCSVTYKFNIPFDAYFDIYVYIAPNTVNSTNVRYIVYSQNGQNEVFIDQKNTKNTGWNKLGSYYLTKGFKNIIKLDNFGIENGKYIVADAGMIMINRKLSPGVIVTDIQEVQSRERGQIKDFILMQNYPNPFNPITTIEFTVDQDKPEKTKINVINILGEKLESLADTYFSKGQHKVLWNAVNYPSGVYFYELISGNQRIVKKMSLIK